MIRFLKFRDQFSCGTKASSLGAFVVLALLSTGCASYQTKINDPYSRLLNHQAAEAAELFKPLAEKEGDDQLVFLLEYATALHSAGNYEESTKAFLKAYDMVEIKDYHSLSKITGSVLLNEGMVQYKGEDFEKVMINVYLAINYLMMGKLEDAQVETRRINDILYKFKFEANRNYDQNPFARYLSAMIWESNKNWDSTYIDYKNTYDLVPQFSLLPEDLIWSSKKAQRPEELAKWKSQFPDRQVPKERGQSDFGELVVVYQQGQGPVKRPHPSWGRVPKLYPIFVDGVKAKVLVSTSSTDAPASAEPEVTLQTETVFSVQDVAIKTLDDQYSELIAKRVAGVVAKAVVSDQIRQKNKLLGDLAWIGMNLADQADLRQWASLPASLQIARKFLKVGRYKVKIQSLSASGDASFESMPETEIEIQPRKKTFVTWRSFR